MGNCNSTTNKRKNQTEPSNQAQPSKSRAQPPKEQPTQTNTQPVRAQEETRIKPLKVIAKEKGNIIFNGEFERDKKIEEIYKEYLDPLRDYEISYNNKLLNINSSSKLKDIFNNNIDSIELTIEYTGLDISDNCRNIYESSTRYIGSVLLDTPETFGLVVYNTSTQQTSPFTYSVNSDDILNNFGVFSAFCNANNKLYLSGGEIQSVNSTTEYTRYMVEINLETANRDTIEVTKLPDLNEARSWHSMIFIPDQKIFIVGGTDSQSVEVYDIEKHTMSMDSKMNEKRSECTLCLIDNTYLYAFCGFVLHQSFVNSIERCNLRRSKRTWEMVDIQYENNITFIPSFFAVSYYQDGLLLLGGNENTDEKEQNYVVKIPNTEKANIVISEYHSFDNVAGIYREKLFLPINQYESILLPLVSSNIRVLTMDERNGEITKREYNLAEDSDRY